MEACVDMIREHNKEATVITTPWDELTGEQLLAAMEKPVSLADMVMAEEEICPVCGGHHDHDMMITIMSMNMITMTTIMNMNTIMTTMTTIMSMNIIMITMTTIMNMNIITTMIMTIIADAVMTTIMITIITITQMKSSQAGARKHLASIQRKKWRQF